MIRFRSQLKKRISKCLCSLTVVVMLIPLISCMIIPAEAASIEPAFNVADMRVGATFSLYTDGVLVGSYSSSSSQTRGQTFSWQWDYYSTLYFDFIVIIIQGDKPSYLYFEQPGTSRKTLCEYEGTVDGYHTYRCDSYNIGDLVAVTAEYSTVDVYDYNLVSCYGFYDVTENIDSMYAGARYYDTMDEGWGGYIWKSGTSFPFYFSNDGIPSLSKMETIYELRPSQRETEYADSISYLVRICGKNPEFGAYLSNSRSGNPISVFDKMDVHAIGAGEYETDYGLDSSLRYQWYLVTFDLTGFDLVGHYINFRCTVDIDQGYSLVSLFACSISSMVENEPNFWGRLFNWLSNIYDSIAGDPDNSVVNDVNEGSSIVSDAEGQYIAGIEENTDVILDTFNFDFVSVSLAFVATYFNKAFLSLGSYSIVFLLPLAIAWILFLLNRVTPSMAPRIKHSSDRSTNQTE